MTAMNSQTKTPAIANNSIIRFILSVLCFTVSQNGKLFKGSRNSVDIGRTIPYSKRCN